MGAAAWVVVQRNAIVAVAASATVALVLKVRMLIKGVSDGYLLGE